ncbi:MAG: efflux RND transporter periplasmic adaptor subunit [Acidobacteriota bacterium]
MKKTLILAGCFPILFLACTGRPAGRDAAPEAAGETAAGAVVLTAEAAATAGIKTAAVEMRTFHPSVKASGTVVLNQKRYVKVTPRVPGRVEKVFVTEGDQVRAGQDLFWLWSTEAMAAQAEYLQILGRVAPAGRPASEDEKLHADLLASAEARLRFMGFSDADLASLRSTRQALPVLAVRAPLAGTIVEAEAAVGTAAETGTCLCAVADLTSLWVQVNIFEADLAAVEVGAEAELTVTAYPGRVFRGRLAQVGAFIDEATRTVKGRLEAANPGGRLKPGMFGEVRLVAREAVTFLAVPEEAVRTIDGKTVVFVPAGGGRYVRRDVATGRAADGWIEILSGLQAGETVVTGGSFDVKAEMLKGTLEGE